MENTDSDARKVKQLLEGQLRECYGRIVCTHKTQEKCADILQKRLSRIKFWQISLSAATTSGFVAVIAGAGQVGALLGIIVAGILLGLNAYTKDQNFGELAQKHRQSAADLWAVREAYLSLLTDFRINEVSIGEVRARRDSLQADLELIYSSAPDSNDIAHNLARESLKLGDSLNFSDDEIDSLLPSGLSRS